MAKFKPFISPFHNLTKLIRPLRPLYQQYLRINIFDGNVMDDELIINPFKKHRYYALGGFNPLIAMWKDVVDTFKPYYSGFYVARDFLQPVRGLGNVIKGIFNIVAATLILIVSPVQGLIKKINSRNRKEGFSFSTHMKMNFAMAVGGLLHGVTNLIRGVTQVFATLLLPLRLLSRSISTCANDSTLGGRLRSRALKIKALINKENKTLDDAVKIDNAKIGFYNKIKRAGWRNETIGFEAKGLDHAYIDSMNFMPEVTSADFKIAATQVNDTHDTRLKAHAFFDFFAEYKDMSTPLIPPGHNTPVDPQIYQVL